MRRLAAIAPLLLLAACTAFDGLDADGASAARSAGTNTTTSTTAPAGTEDDETAPSSTTTPAEANANPSAPSCTQKHGGATCGPDGQSDCCAIAAQGDTKLGKYLITAGRMRAFIDQVNGDVAGFVKGLGADTWKPAWSSDELPTDRASADVALGPAGKKACEQGANTGHTFWTPKTGDDFSDYDRETLDEKALNCVPWSLAQALCVFDGGHLATTKELRSAFTNGGSTKFPWGDDDLDPSRPDERLNQHFGFATEKVPATFRGEEHPTEVSFFIAPPGRFPKGDNQAGVADSAGNLLEWVGDGPRQFVWKADFEEHGVNAKTLAGSIWMDREMLLPGIPTGRPWTWGTSQLAGNAGNDAQKGGYYAIGARCAF